MRCFGISLSVFLFVCCSSTTLATGLRPNLFLAYEQRLKSSLLYPGSFWPKNFSIDQSTRAELLRVHNAFRAQVSPPAANMLFMIWNKELEKLAQDYADQCQWSSGPSFTTNSSTFSRIGQNVFALNEDIMRNLSLRPRDIVSLWASEKSEYYFNSKDDHCSFSRCGNYTQIVWAETLYLGCGTKLCASPTQSGYASSTVFVVCNYGPGGNLEGQSAYEIGRSCTKCPEKFNQCVEKLCEAFPRCLPVASICKNYNKTNCLCDEMPNPLASINRGRETAEPSTIIIIIIVTASSFVLFR